jgi:hypothetical protein
MTALRSATPSARHSSFAGGRACAERIRNALSTMSVLPGRVRCHHPRDRFTRVQTTDGRGRWGGRAPMYRQPTSAGHPAFSYGTTEMSRPDGCNNGGSLRSPRRQPEARRAWDVVSVGAGTARAARRIAPAARSRRAQIEPGGSSIDCVPYLGRLGRSASLGSGVGSVVRPGGP